MIYFANDVKKMSKTSITMMRFFKKDTYHHFYIENYRRLFFNIVSLLELNGLKSTEKQYIITIYQTDIYSISVQVWSR